jgi:hypothetical protein
MISFGTNNPDNHADAFVAVAPPRIHSCTTRRLSGELKTYMASAECSNLRIIEAYQKAGYRYMDLIFLIQAKRRELSEKIDKGNLTEAQAQLEFAQFMTGINDKERQRDREQR